MKRLAFGLLLLASTSVGWAQTTLTLDEALRLAADQSPSVVAARAEVRAAREFVRMRQAGLLPQVSVNAFAVDSKAGTLLESAPGKMGSSVSLLPLGRSWMANLMLMWPLYSGGTLQADVAEARALERRAQADLKEMVAEASLMAEEAFLMALLADAELEAAQARVRAATEMVRTMNEGFRAGMMTEAAAQRAKAELAMAERMQGEAETDKAKAILELQSILGLELGSDLRLAGSLDGAPEPEELPGWVQSAALRRGTILRAQADVDSAEARARSAQGESKPSIFAQVMSERAKDPMMSGTTVGLTLSFPLFDGGERRSQAREARSMLDRARLLLRQAQLAAEKDVRQAFLDLRLAQADVTRSNTEITAASAAYEVARLRVEAGRSLLLEQLDLLQVLTEARYSLAKARYRLRLSTAKLRRAAGLSQGESL